LDNYQESYVFVFLGSIIFCLLYKLTLSDQASVNLQLAASPSDMQLRFLAGPPLVGGANFFFSRGNEPALGGRVWTLLKCFSYVTWLRMLSLSFFLSFFLSSSDLFLPTHCRCRGYCCTWSHSMTHTFTHTHTHTHTHGRTHLDEVSVRRTDLYLTTHNTHKRQTHPCPPAGFEPAIPACERPPGSANT